MSEGALNKLALALDENLVLSAGAGAGKTHALVTLCLHLLGGARRGGAPIHTAQLFMVTFTDKAATEMRERLRQRLDALAHGEEEDGELPLRERSFWRRVRDELGEATIGTFHALCASILRRAPAGAGIDPSFALLDEREAEQLVRDCAERTVLELLEAGDPAVADLCRELSFLDRGRSGGLVTQVCELFDKIREEGFAPEAVPISDEASARAEFRQAASSLQAAISAAASLNARERGPFGEVLGRCAEASSGMTVEVFPQRFNALLEAVEAMKGLRGRNGLCDAVRAVRTACLGSGNGQLGLRDCYAGVAMIPHEGALRALLCALAKRHRAELDRRASLDFSDLLIRTRDLLRDHTGLRREAQERIGALLIDEFQDTNRLQLEIALLLAEKRDGSPRRLTAEDSLELQIPLEPGLLCAVGDRKQSIYEFRGADVSVFKRLAKKIEAEGGRRIYLKANRRSSPSLTSFFNQTFARVMSARPEPRDYEVAYHPATDDQQAVRTADPVSPPVDWLVFEPGENAEESRLKEADALAKRIRQLLSDAGGARRGSDVAILFRRFTYVEAYRQALVRHGVPHRIIRGRGFYGAQEVLDLAAALALIADPSDALSFAAVLRSPLVCVCDASLVKLSTVAGGKLALSRLRQPGALLEADLPADEKSRCERFVTLYPKLRRERDRLGIRNLLRVLLEETEYAVAVAGTPFGEQALANVEKLLELAGRWDRAAKGGCAGFARELLELADADPIEAQADPFDSADSRAVQLLTIHQAKGLEWPIVFVPDIAAQRSRHQGAIAFDRQQGLSVRVPLGDGLDAPKPPRFVRACAELARRDDAEYLRLLYVALTRARDLLVLSGQASRSAKTWRGMLEDSLGPFSPARLLVREVKAAELPLPAPVAIEEPAPSSESERRIESVVSRVRMRAPPRAEQAAFSVTQLQDFALCPRRFFYAHRAGLTEYPSVLEIDEGGEPAPLGGRGAMDKRAQGTLAHRLLERVDPKLAYGNAKVQRDRLAALAWDEGVDPSAPDARQVIDWAQRFLGTSFARRLATAGPARIHRELPFLLRLEDGGGGNIHVTGQIDLLFEDEDSSALVVDYKTSERHPDGLAPYDFQLDCYAMAARQLVNSGVAVRTGIAFLQQRSPEPELRPPGSAETLSDLERQLTVAASSLLSAAHRNEWTGQPKSRCEQIHCGYQYRCHANGRGV